MGKLRGEKFLNKWVAQCSFNNDCHDCKAAPECGLAYLQIMEIIQKPEVTEEWIQEKGMRIACKHMISEVRARKIVRSIVEEIK